MPLPRGLRTRCERIVSQLPIPDPFSAEALAEALAAERGRPIQFLPLPPAADSSSHSGLWVPLASVDVLFYSTRTSLAHQTQIKLHELGHVIAGHQPEFNPEMIRTAFPDMEPSYVSQLFGLPRASYDTVQEQEAEVIGLLLANLIGSGHGTTPDGRRLTSTLAHPVRRTLGAGR
ncbi:hypothetical protein ABTX81_30525 [Kitasatospora sp. NPDC097605]|uniref:hypothetical protein n=1 Tax=Kitasatospora sp. NPDC097605 TaxID=3157226 RepID=UPI0033206BE9